MLDRDGSRTPIQFHISNDRNLHFIDAPVAQAATKWKVLKASKAITSIDITPPR
jgi:aspartate--ammonia ligase